MRDYIIFLGLVALIGFAAGAAQAEGFPNPRVQYEQALSEGWSTSNEVNAARQGYGGARQVGGGKHIVIDPFAYPTYRELMHERKAAKLERARIRDYYRERNTIIRSTRGKPCGGYPIPTSDGYRVSNPLGTVYCGTQGCWR